MTGVTVRTILRGVMSFTNPTTLLLFTRTRAGKHAAGAYQARMKRRRTGRDAPVTPEVFRAQLRAVNRWGHQQAAVNALAGGMLVLHGDSDRMVPSDNAEALRDRFPGAEVLLFPDSGHGIVFHNRRAIADSTHRLLQR